MKRISIKKKKSLKNSIIPYVLKAGNIQVVSILVTNMKHVYFKEKIVRKA